MLRLILWNSTGGTQYDIDLYENVPVNLNYQFADVTEINKAKGSYSQTFRVPASNANKRFFGSIENPAVQPNGLFSVKRKIIAELTYNSVPMMRGYVQVKSVYVQKKDFSEIELVFFGEVLTLAKALEEKEISALDTSSLDHKLNYSNVSYSWAGYLESGNIVYGIMDKGRNWTQADDSVYNNEFIDVNNGIWQAEMTPYIRLKWLLDKIISNAGFTYSSTFLATNDFLKMYMPCYNGSGMVRAEENSAETQVASAGITSDFTLTSSYQTIPVVDTATGGYDYGTNFSNTTHKWTAPYDCLITVSYRFTPTNLSFNNFDTRLYINGAVAVQTAGGGGNTMYQRLCLSGETVYLTSKENSQQQVVLDANNAGQNQGNWLRIDEVSEPLMGQDVLIKDNLPKIKQIDFLMGLQKMFNLVFVPDSSKPNHLIIEPFQDYLTTGTKKDWTNKIDYSKDVVVSPTTDLQRNIFDFTHDAGQDFVNVAVQNSTGRTYGRMRLQDEENDFATGSQELKTPFSPYLMSLIPSTQIAIHRAIDKDGKGIQTPKPQVAYYSGLQSQTTWYLRNDSGDEVTLNQIPVFSNYDSVNPNVTSNDLNFGHERAFFSIDSHPLNTLYYKFWKSYVNELYSESSRLLTAYVKLNRADIQDFEFSDRIFINDTYFRILKINNYDAAAGGVVKVDFIKIISDIRDCTYLPTGQLSTGEITFNSSNSNWGNRECCERYGYIWINRKGGISQCYPTTFQQQPTN